MVCFCILFCRSLPPENKKSMLLLGIQFILSLGSKRAYGNLGVFQGQVHPLRTPRGHICGRSPSFPGVGVMQKGQTGEAAERGEGVGREQRGWGTHAEAKHLDHSAQGPGLDLDGCHSMIKGAPGRTWNPGGDKRGLPGARRGAWLAGGGAFPS